MTDKATVLKEALKKERDSRVVLRIAAVNMVVVEGQSTGDAARYLMMSDDWVRKWADRYESGGLEALRDRPRAGRPPKMEAKKLEKIMRNASRKRLLPRDVDGKMRKDGVAYSDRHIRRLLRAHNFSPKKLEYVHVNHDSPADVRAWQEREKRVIAHYRHKGYTIGWEDEAHYGMDMDSHVRFWSEVGTPVSATLTSEPGRVSAHGLLLEDMRHMVRLHDKANSETFIGLLREARGRFGPLLIYADRASYHQSRKVADFLRDNPEIVVRYTPVGSPYVNPAEHMWLITSKSPVSYRYHSSFADFRKDLSRHYRTVRYKVDPIKCMNQRPKEYAKF